MGNLASTTKSNFKPAESECTTTGLQLKNLLLYKLYIYTIYLRSVFCVNAGRLDIKVMSHYMSDCVHCRVYV